MFCVEQSRGRGCLADFRLFTKKCGRPNNIHGFATNRELEPIHTPMAVNRDGIRIHSVAGYQTTAMADGSGPTGGDVRQQTPGELT